MAGLFSLLGGAGSIAAGYGLANDIRGVGEQAAGQMGDLASQLQADTGFKGYGVSTGLGTTTVNPDGSTNLGVGQDQALVDYGNNMMGQSQANFGQASKLAKQGANNANAQQALGYMQQGANNAFTDPALAAMQGGMMGLGGQQGMSLNASQQAMQNAMQSVAGREQDIYNRAMAMQNPQLDAAQAQQQAREYAMGRGGVRGSQFGGTAEDAAMARARAQASNQASFQAMGQAQQEMLNQGQLANQFGQMGLGAAGLQNQIGQDMGNLGYQNAQLAANAGMNMQNAGLQNAQLSQSAAGLLGQFGSQQGQLGMSANAQSYLPMQNQLNALQVGQGNANMAQTGQITGANLAGQLGLGGIQSQVNAEKAASELYGNLFNSGMTAIGGLGSNSKGFLETIKGWI